MALKARIFGAGKLLILLTALAVTYFVFAAGAARIALKAREVKVPDLHGRSLSSSSAALSDLGLQVRVDETRRTTSDVPEGYVATQDPTAGSTVRRGRSIKVWLSAGTLVGKVPDLVGETEQEARMRLQQSGISVGSVAEIRSTEYPPDTVIGEEPPANSNSSTVSLLVNRGDRGPTYLMPDLIGVDGDRAAEFLRRKGFRVAVVGSQPYPGIPPGVVLRQSPQSGFQVAPGQAISIEVSR
jgi:beta-lactam-binding protein with PASTA domain